MAVLTYLAVWADDSPLRQTIASSLALLLASTIGSFIFGAVWDDQGDRRAQVDAMAINSGLPPAAAVGPTVVQQNNAPRDPVPVPLDPVPPDNFGGN